MTRRRHATGRSAASLAFAATLLLGLSLGHASWAKNLLDDTAEAVTQTGNTVTGTVQDTTGSTDAVDTVTDTVGGATGTVNDTVETVTGGSDDPEGTVTDTVDDVTSVVDEIAGTPIGDIPPEVIALLPPEVVQTITGAVDELTGTVGGVVDDVTVDVLPTGIPVLPDGTVPDEVLQRLITGDGDEGEGEGAGSTTEPGVVVGPDGTHAGDGGGSNVDVEVSVGQPHVREPNALTAYASNLGSALKLAAQRALALAGPLAPPLGLMGIAVIVMLALARPPKQIVKAERSVWTPTGRAYKL